jgi:diamine N-acetyltransferase
MSATKITLRKLNSTDLDLLISIETDPENLMFSAGQSMPTVSELTDFLHSKHDLILHEQLRLAIEYRGTAVGFADLFDTDFRRLKAFVGIIILKEFRRKGIALQALKELETFARLYKLQTLWAKCQHLNFQSLNLFKNAGFEEVSYNEDFILLRLML